jgi:DNA processing protein
MNEAVDRLRLARSEGVGPVTYRRLLTRYGKAAAALEALPHLARAGGKAEMPAIPSAAAARGEIEKLERLGGRLLFLDSQDYPPLLALLDDAPPILSLLGDPAILGRRAVALVGSRNASANGQRIAEALAAELAEAGLAIVSGLARGIDTAAHLGALRAGATIACVAGGIDIAYPPENAGLQARIGSEGAVIAEMPLGTTPQARHFPRRNRVIAGLALGVVVVEAAPRSGSLITARLAQEAGRELFAVPGSPLDPRCRGSNGLIRDGAHLTETAADVLANLPDHPLREGIGRSPLFARGPAPERAAEPTPEFADASSAEQGKIHARLLELLGPSPVPVDELVRRCGFPPAAVNGVLLDLEIAGRIETLPGNRVTLLS